MDTQEIDVLLQRNAELEKELAAKNRELQIEAALESVRSRALIMQQPAELVKVAQLLRNEMALLGVEELEGSSISVHNEATGKTDMWYAIKDDKRKDKFVADHIDIDLKETWVGRQMLQFYRSGRQQISIPMQGAHRKEWIEYCAARSEHSRSLGSFYEETMPDRTYHLYRFSSGFVGAASPGDISAESWNLLQRATAVFSMAYARFSDLQKAEAQAREARIEAALERVRARTMTMQKSDELDETNMLILQRLESLDISLSGIGIHICYSDTPESEAWMWDILSGKVPKVLYNHTHDRLSARIYEGWKKGESLYVEEVYGERLKEHLNYISTLLHDPTIYEGSVSSFVFHIVYFTYGFFVLATPAHCPAEHPVFIRFAKVFEQTYTRFLDLQKAEAQAREAQIEAALERVRSRTMAMQRSEELSAVATVLFQQVKALGVPQWVCGFNIWDIGDTKCKWYPGSPDGEILTPGWFPLTEHPVFRIMDESRKRGDELYILEKGGELQADHYRYMMTLPGVRELLQDMLNAGLAIPTFQIDHFANFAYGNLIFITYEHFPEMHEIFKRFAKVFEQTYTRFLDLQKAEAQAREAHIEAALERVRARTMAMQKSEELGEVIQVIFDQLCALHFRIDSASFVVETNETNDLRNWLAAPGRKYASRIDVPYINHPIFNRFVEAKEKGETFYTLQLTKEEKDAFFDYYLRFAPIPEERKTIIYNSPGWAQSAVLLKTIGLNITNYAALPYSEDQNKTLVRFGKAFEQTYIRFLDLQRAEAQAVRAEQDLVEIKAARRKAEEALLTLKATQVQLVQKEKMASLGELTAGIAHEIQNPLNFVSNFSAVNKELLTELVQELHTGNIIEARQLAKDARDNEEKIVHHSKRADSIVKGMLQHARSSTGQKEPTDINVLVEEHLRLAFHAVRAKDKTFDATLQLDYDQRIGRIPVVPQEIGRVLINLFNNAFYAVCVKKQQLKGTYEPVVFVSTKTENGKVKIIVKDNGDGIPSKALDKIFQPFFTTKPTGEGTGLGLSLSYDIVTKGHGGELKVESKEGEGSAFVVELPFT